MKTNTNSAGLERMNASNRLTPGLRGVFRSLSRNVAANWFRRTPRHCACVMTCCVLALLCMSQTGNTQTIIGNPETTGVFGGVAIKLAMPSLVLYQLSPSGSGSLESLWEAYVDPSDHAFKIYNDSHQYNTARVPFTIADGAPTNSLYVNHYGEVGIGTNSPAATLHVSDPTGIATIRLDGLHAAGITQSWEILSDSVGNAVPGGGFALASSFGGPYPLRVQTGAPTNSLFIGSTGHIGLGVATPKNPLQLAGGAYCSGTKWINACSRDYKENIEPLSLEQARDTVQKLQSVTYRYKNEEDGQAVGFIAEDVPELVATKDRKGLSAMDITAVLTKVVQDQDRQLAEEREKVARQQQLLETLSRRLTDLEQKIGQSSVLQQNAN